MTREEEAFKLRGQAAAVLGFVSAGGIVLSEKWLCALEELATAQLRLAHALTLPPTRFRSG